jgi:predicted RNA polymerase sigma factor
MARALSGNPFARACRNRRLPFVYGPERRGSHANRGRCHDTRTAADGSFVRLADQDRARWDRELIAEDLSLVRACLRRNAPGPYQIQAAIQAVHADAPTAEATG